MPAIGLGAVQGPSPQGSADSGSIRRSRASSTARAKAAAAPRGVTGCFFVVAYCLIAKAAQVFERDMTRVSPLGSDKMQSPDSRGSLGCQD